MIADNAMKPELAVELLRRIQRIRITEETIAQRYAEWKMRCPTHLCTGQEAIGAAVGLVLRQDDFMLSTHRSHGHYLGKGGNINKMIAEIYTKSTGCSGGKGGSMHLIDKQVNFMGSTSIVGGTIPVAVGLGLSISIKGTDQVSCVFFGDGAVEEGVFYESINFAVLKRLPVLFICENNFYSVYSPLRVRQPAGRSIHQMVEAMGIASYCGDGNDVLAVYDQVSTTVDNIRQGNGPCFFEFHTYRWHEHCGPNFDNDLGYRTEDEFLEWKAQDPVLKLQNELLARDIVNQDDISRMEKTIHDEVCRSFDFAENSPFPAPEKAFADLYRE